MNELHTGTNGNVGARRADAGSAIRELGERARPKISKGQELGLAIARVLQDRGLRLELERCTQPGGAVSAMEILSGRADKNPDGRSLIGAVTRVISDDILMISLAHCSGTNGTSRSAADILREYAMNPNNWDLDSWRTHSRSVEGMPRIAWLGTIPDQPL